jgi:hypothetical protein
MASLPTNISESTRKRNPELYGLQMPTDIKPDKRTKRAVKNEGDLHDELESHCTAQGYLCAHSRMDVPSTIAVGFPDFVIFMPERKTCFLECKSKTGKATIKQLGKIAHARKLGYVAEIVDNMPDALAAIERAKLL